MTAAWRRLTSMPPTKPRLKTLRRWPLAGTHTGAGAPPAMCRPACPTSSGRRPHHVQAAVGDLLDLMGQPGGRELILLSILSSCHHPLRAGRRAWSAAAGRSGCSSREVRVFWSERLGADAPHALRAAAPRKPLQHAFVCRCRRRLPVLVGVVGRCLRCACCVRSDACWRGCAGLCMVSMAG
jgi:hypothetical protein